MPLNETRKPQKLVAKPRQLAGKPQGLAAGALKLARARGGEAGRDVAEYVEFVVEFVAGSESAAPEQVATPV
ncbi:MAG: hypothetical protein AW08_02463 [Candidatus Accumulibacter adjunctus]|uniref:Uncharacterized protein n=1 Tax=Candidatus Accumulibacter adjunctus TaxID=1454001 RepID=A0A011MA15_9PROT|nr:MAG: hypothetical protein AW08_02463 [Candidatus Accumulibacter adjunctus]